MAAQLEAVFKKELLAFEEKSGAIAQASTGTFLQVVKQLHGALLSFAKTLFLVI